MLILVELPFVENDGVKIHYEVFGEGHPIIFQHGVTVNLEVWKWAGFVEQLAKKYQLILLDARGHGQSDKPHTAESYAMKHMVADIVAVLDDLELDKASFLGYSMGGRIGIAIGKYAPERFDTLIIGGADFSERDSKEEIENSKDSIERYKRYMKMVEDYHREGWSEELPEWRRVTLPVTDFESMIAYRSYSENIGIAEYVPQLSIPCLIYAGELDTNVHSRSKSWAENMKNAEFVSLKGLDHAEAHFDCSAIIPHVEKFLEKVLNP